jgi:hypothetical protein
MARKKDQDQDHVLSRRDALRLLGAVPVNIAVFSGLMAEVGAMQIGAPRNLRIVGSDLPKDSPLALNQHPRTYLTPTMVTQLRSQIASDAAFRARWQTAVTQFEESGGYWAKNSVNYFTIGFATFLTAVRRPNDDLGLKWASSWQTYRNRILSAAMTTWQKELFNELTYAPVYWAAALIYDLLYQDLTASERTALGGRVTAWANAWKENNYRWNDQDSDDHVTTVLCAMAADDAKARVERAYQLTRDWAESRAWMSFSSGVGYETKEFQPTQVGPLIAMYVLRNATGMSAAETTGIYAPVMKDAWQLYRQFAIPHPSHANSGRHWITDRVNMAGGLLYQHRALAIAPNMIWALALLEGVEPEMRYLQYELTYGPPSAPSHTLREVLNTKWIDNQSSGPVQANAQGFYAFIPWLALNAQERSPAEPSSLGIPKVRRWWPGALDWTTIRSDFGNTTASLISYHHRKYHVSKYELGCRQNGSWHAHRAGPLLIQRGTSTHVVSTRFHTWDANGTITFADTKLPEGTPYNAAIDETDGGGVRPGASTKNKTEAIAAGAINNFGDVSRWHGDDAVVAITSDLTRSYNSTVYAYKNGAAGNEPKVSSFVREFVVVQRGGDGTSHERIFTYDRLMVAGNGRFIPHYNLNPGPPQIDINGTETPHTPWLPGASGPTRWDYTGATRMIVANNVEPKATIAGNGKVCVTWLRPSGAGVKIRKRGGTAFTNDPAGKIVPGNPFFNQYGGPINEGSEWTKNSDTERRAYSGMFRVEIIPAAFTPDTRFLVVADVMTANDAPSPAEELTTSAASVAARCGATAVVFARDNNGHSSGSVTLPAGVSLVVLVNLPAGAQRNVTTAAGLSVTTANRVASNSGVLTLGVSGSGVLNFA